MWHRNQEKTNKLKRLRRYEMEMRRIRQSGNRLRYLPQMSLGWYESVKPFWVGVKHRLVPIETRAKNEAGLAEAVDAASGYVLFSSNSKRFCDLKSHRCNLPQGVDRDSFIRQKYFAGGKRYVKGNLDLCEVSERDYLALSSAAQKWFVRCEKIEVGWRGHRSLKIWFELKKVVSKAWLREVSSDCWLSMIWRPDCEKLRRLAFLQCKLSPFFDAKMRHEFFPSSYRRQEKSRASGWKKRERKELDAQLCVGEEENE